MVFYDYQSKIDQKEKEIYEKVTEKQYKYASKVFLLVFGIIGLIFLLVGIITLALGVTDEEGFLVGIIFAPMGGFFLLMGLVIFLIFKKTANYAFYKRNREKYMNSNPYFCQYGVIELMAKVEVLTERVEELEAKLIDIDNR